jgi:hypothetical protein
MPGRGSIVFFIQVILNHFVVCSEILFKVVQIKILMNAFKLQSYASNFLEGRVRDSAFFLKVIYMCSMPCCMYALGSISCILHCAKLFDQKIDLYGPPSYTKKVEILFHDLKKVVIVG